MITFFVCLGLVLIGVVILKIGDNENSDGLLFAGVATVVVSGVCLLIVVLAIFLCPIDIRSEILEFKSVEESLLIARNNSDISQLELAALQHKVVEMNKWLANAQFWTKHPLTNWFWPKEILALSPIK